MKLQQPGAMKVWKSPVLYFGVLLVIAVAGLLMAPFVVDWNGYRGDLEAYGKKLTGREVTVEGPVSVRLFPWPRLTAENVRVASPDGMAAKDFASAARITVKMTLAGLLQGGIDVESIEIADPELNFERMETGEDNWAIQPSADLLNSDVLSRVRLDKITVTSGTVNFHDHRRGETVTLDDINADVASPGVAGPWRMRANASFEGKPVEVAVNTAAYVPGQPYLFGVKFQSTDNSGHVFSFDGAYKDGAAQGDVLVAPAQTEDGKGDAEGQIRPLVFSAKAKGNFDQLDFTDIQLARDDPGNAGGGAVATGSASLRFGRHIDAKADMTASMLDLDELAGAKSRDILRQAGGLAVLDGLLAMLPADMSLQGSAKVTALKSEGTTFDNVSLAFDAARDRLKIDRLYSGLPGRSESLFKGSYFPAPGGGELSGDLSLETADLRALTLWLWRDGRDRLSPMWTGSRGRLKMETAVSVTPAGFRLTGTDFELDGERGNGALSVNSAGRGAVDLDLESGRFDLDAYAPQGIPAIQTAASQGAGSLLGLVLPRADAPDLRLKVKLGELEMNTVAARNVGVDLQSGVNGLDLRALSIGEVGGANLSASGLVLDNGRGADGSISLDVKADDPSGLIRLMGLAGSNGLPAWAQGLGTTALNATLAVKPGPDGSAMTLKAGGTAGEITVAVDGTLAHDMTLSGTARAEAPNSARILALLGLSAVGQDPLPGSIAVAGSGSAQQGFKATATLQALGARLDYQGGFSPLAEGYGLNGTLSLRATDAGPLFAGAGLPVAQTGGVLVADTALSWGEGKWSFAGLNGRLGTAPFSGAASLTPAFALDGRLETGPLNLADVAAASLLDWTGPAAGLETQFAKALPFGLTGQLWITPSALTVNQGFTAQSAEIGIAAKAGEVQLAVRGKDADGRDAAIEINSAGKAESRSLSGSIKVPVDLAKQLALAGGTPVASGEGAIDLTFRSEGRSPGAALAAAQGEGHYAFDGFRLLNLTPSAFTAGLAAAKDSSGITAAFDAMRGGDGLDFGAAQGAITLTGGEMTFAPFQHGDGDADVSVKTVADLGQGQVDMDIGLTLKARPGLPPMSIAYAGPPMALVRTETSSELATALGVTLMQEGITELERLQQEQVRLAKEEEIQRAEDEARLQAYYAQRDELLLRKRELKVQAEMQVVEADRLRRQIEAERAANAEINKAETRQRLRELRTWRKMAKLTEQQPAPARPPAPVPPPEQKAQASVTPPATETPIVTAPLVTAPVVSAPVATPPVANPAIANPPAATPPVAEAPVAAAPPAPPLRVDRPSQPMRKPPPKVKPMILAKPPGAPVIVSPEPGTSPSQ